MHADLLVTFQLCLAYSANEVAFVSLWSIIETPPPAAAPRNFTAAEVRLCGTVTAGEAKGSAGLFRSRGDSGAHWVGWGCAALAWAGGTLALKLKFHYFAFSASFCSFFSFSLFSRFDTFVDYVAIIFYLDFNYIS